MLQTEKEVVCGSSVFIVRNRSWKGFFLALAAWQIAAELDAPGDIWPSLHHVSGGTSRFGDQW